MIANYTFTFIVTVDVFLLLLVYPIYFLHKQDFEMIQPYLGSSIKACMPKHEKKVILF